MVATLNSVFSNFIFGLSSRRDFDRDTCGTLLDWHMNILKKI